MTRHVNGPCIAALLIVLAAPISAQTPLQSPPVVRPYAIAPAATPAQQIATLQQEISALQTALAAVWDTVAKLKRNTQFVTSDGANMTLRAPGGVTVMAGTGVSLEGGTAITVKAGTVLTLTGQATASLNAPTASVIGNATLQLQAGVVTIGSGSNTSNPRPAARVTDQVANGSVITGSPSVLIQ